ncbi:MAG: secondary thiamine-phosphate synthase enzyme YjbQ [Minisyncoccia bacterium]
MKIKNKTIEFQTKSEYDFIDLTDQIKDFVKESEIENGLVNIQNFHTSSALIFNENEPLLLEDIKNNLEKLAPKDIKYNHDNFEIRTVNFCPGECPNGHSHCRAIYLLSTITLNLIEGKLQLGTYQRIMFVELDRSRPRKIQIQIIGE